MIKLPALPADLPWTLPAYLLLDGVSLPNLVKRLGPWGNPLHSLYRRTRWQELSDISPCLIEIKGLNDPLLAYFRDHAAEEWGYLLFSDIAAYKLLEHWRHLLSVEHPSGVEVMPRIADPAVMHPIFALAEQAASARWFGPVQHVCLPDAVALAWRQHQRPASASAEPKIYRLTDAELAALGDVEFRQFVSGLNQHLQTHFPAFMATLAEPERRPYARQVAEQAYAQGFTSAQEITLYANIFGYLAGKPLADHPDIVQRLTQPPTDAPLNRVKRAAELAELRTSVR